MKKLVKKSMLRQNLPARVDRHSKPLRISTDQDETVMLRKNMYITHAQNRSLKRIHKKYGKSESQQLREALCMYFGKLGIEL